MTTATLHNNVQQLCEHIHDWRTPDVLVDQSRRIVHNIAWTGRDSKNGYRYSEQALRQAVSLYENKPVFLDHAANISRPHERSTRDLAGSIVNPRYEEGRIRSDIQLLDTEAGRTFLALAESKSPAVGMSHVVLAERSGDRSVVEVIHDVVSIDAVVFPATTSTFSESQREATSIPLAGSLEAVLADVDNRLPNHVRRLIDNPAATIYRKALFHDKLLLEIEENDQKRQCVIDWQLEDDRTVLGEELTTCAADQPAGDRWSAGRLHSVLANNRQVEQLQSQLQQATDERDQLREQLQRLQSEQRDAEQLQEIERLLAESDLPEAAVSDVFRDQLLAAPDANTRTLLLEERQHLLQRSFPQQPFSRERRTGSAPILTDAAIISSIKQQRASVLLGIG